MDGHIRENLSEHMTDMLKTMKMLRTKVFEQDAVIRKFSEPFESEKMEVEASSSASASGITDTKETVTSISPTGSMVSPMTSRLEVRKTFCLHESFFL